MLQIAFSLRYLTDAVSLRNFTDTQGGACRLTQLEVDQIPKGAGGDKTFVVFLWICLSRVHFVPAIVIVLKHDSCRVVRLRDEGYRCSPSFGSGGC